MGFISLCARGMEINSGVRRTGRTFTVAGGSNNNYFSMGGMVPAHLVQPASSNGREIQSNVADSPGHACGKKE